MAHSVHTCIEHYVSRQTIQTVVLKSDVMASKIHFLCSKTAATFWNRSVTKKGRTLLVTALWLHLRVVDSLL